MIKGVWAGALGLAAILAPSAARADLMVYTGRPAFEAAIKGEATESFNELSGSSQNFGTTGLGQAQGLTQPLTITGSSSYLFTGSASNNAGFYPANGTYLIGPIANAAGDGITVAPLANSSTAVGADVAPLGQAGMVSFAGTTSLGEHFSGSVRVDAGSAGSMSGFLGVSTGSSTDYVTSLTFSTAVGAFQNIAIDNVSTGQAAPAVPEPAAVALMTTGSLILAAGALRRRSGRRSA